MGQICIPNGDACYDCSEYAGAFACLNKIKVSGMDKLSELGILTALDSKCSDILIPVSKISCEGVPETLSMSLKDLIEITNSTSVGERQAFQDKEFTAVGETETYELTIFNPHPSKSMQISYFAQWSAQSGGVSAEFLLRSDIFVDNVKINDGGGYDVSFGSSGDVYHNQDAGSMPAFYTKIIEPKTYTTIKMELICDKYPNNDPRILRAETIQLMITGVTK